MFKSLNRQIWVLILLFFFLVLISRIATYATVQAENQDTLVVKVAEDEQALVEKMAWLASVHGPQADLDASIQLFDQNLRALRDGGQVVDYAGRSTLLPPSSDADSRKALEQIAADWKTFRSELGPSDSPALQSSAPPLDQELGSLVSTFEERALNRIYPTEFIHEASFGLAVVLLALSYWLARRRIVKPLATLAAAARRIGAGDLNAPLPAMANDDIGELGRAMEATRTQLAAARDELEARVAQRTADLESAFEFLQAIVTQLDLKQLLQDVTERVRNLTRADAASLSLFFEGKTKPSVVTTAGDYEARPAGCHLIECRADGKANSAGQLDISAGQLGIIAAGEWDRHSPPPCASGQCLSVPLRAGEVIFGSICVIRQNGEGFDRNETRALAMLADAAAIAIANARLKEREQFQVQQAAVLTERERMAGELHDNLAQTLGFLNLKMDQLNQLILGGKRVVGVQEVDQCKAAIGMAYGQVRAALVGLHEPLPAAGLEFEKKIAGYLDDLRRETGAEADLAIEDSIAQDLSPLMQAQALHIIREALVNIKRHARAKVVRVLAHRQDNEVRFMIQDDGRGFDPEMTERGNHLGLTIMRARARRSGGSLTVASALGEGTRITACFPMNESMERIA